jgi:hypothetical protein
MKRFTMLTVAGGLAAGLWFGLAQPSDARTLGVPDAGTCKVKDLRGSYMFAASGYNIVNGAAVPKAIHEVLDFKGDGTLEVPFVSLSVNGAINHPPPGVGDYTLDENCRGTLIFNGGPLFDIVASADGSTVWMFQTNAGTVFQGTATRFRR